MQNITLEGKRIVDIINNIQVNSLSKGEKSLFTINTDNSECPHFRLKLSDVLVGERQLFYECV